MARRGTSLARQLAQAWPSYTGYVISFVTIGIMWANHHSMFRLIDRSTHGLVVANLLLLLCVSFVPFPPTSTTSWEEISSMMAGSLE